MHNLLTIKQAAQKLSISKETLRRWDRSGKLKAIIINDRGDRRYNDEDLDRFIVAGFLNNKILEKGK